MHVDKEAIACVGEICINNENLQLDIGLPQSKLDVTPVFSRHVQPKEMDHFYRVHNHLLAPRTFGLTYMVILIKNSPWLF